MYRLKRVFDTSKVASLLENEGISMPQDSSYAVALYNGDEPVAAGFLAGDIIQGLAVKAQYKGEGLMNTIVTELIGYANRQGVYHLFLFTKPENERIFSDIGFKKVGQAKNYAVMMEQGIEGIENYKNGLAKFTAKDIKNAACIVMNLNPLTNGHMYLINKAAQENEKLFIFVVQEDKSFFPFDMRIELVRKETENLSNVTVLPSGKYIISAITFPSYFLKKEDAARAQCLIDVNIFGTHIAPALNINKRYAGTEPSCPVTRIYNRCMREELRSFGIDFCEVERVKSNGEYISASYVRRCIKNNQYDKVRELVPDATFEYLMSDKGKELVRFHLNNETGS